MTERRNAVPIVPLDEAIEKYKEAKEDWERFASQARSAKALEEKAAAKVVEARKAVEMAARHG